MKRQRIYVETSVIGGCFDNEFSEWSNRLMEDFKSELFIPLFSAITEEEIAKAPQNVIDKYHEILLFSPSGMLSPDSESVELAESYLGRGVLTEKFRQDAMHIAIATVINADILVSWNFRHIVHFDKIRRFNGINQELGYKSLEIRTPMEVCSNEE